MLDKMIEVGASWDWVTPVISVFGCLFRGHAGIVTEIPPGWSGHDVCKFIEQEGISTHSRMIIRGQLCFDVPKQYKQATYKMLWRIGGG